MKTDVFRVELSHEKTTISTERNEKRSIAAADFGSELKQLAASVVAG
jgi:hypothetical protein